MKWLLLFLSGLTLTASAATSMRPNIIVFYTDDHGYADLGLHAAVPDIRTPNVDALARSGVLARHGYSTAPQCVPSRAGLLTGRFQGRFNLDSNGGSLDGFNGQTTIASRLQKAGYVTAQFGKWHLGPDAQITRHGFKHVYAQNRQAPFGANISMDGTDRSMGTHRVETYHIDACSQAAASVIARYKDEPFFLYVAYRAPHTPLDAPDKYTSRFPGPMPERRRQALAMLSAVDDGVGLITAALKTHGLTDRTLIFFMGDNGAPLKIHKTDAPLNGDPGGWDGSLNTPMNGEKGMLAEGGIHVPFVVSWPGQIPPGQDYPHPVSALDISATAASLAGLPTPAADFDGVNLLPFLKGDNTFAPHAALYWRWVAQSAIREGNWKLLRGGDREYLYDLSADPGEKSNLAPQHPDVAGRLREKLTQWAGRLNPPGLTLGPMAPVWNQYFDFYLEGKPADEPVVKDRKAKKSKTAGPVSDKLMADGWVARNGALTIKDGALWLDPDEGKQSAFLTRSPFKLTGPLKVKLMCQSPVAGKGAVAWRMDGAKDFKPEDRATFDLAGGTDWHEHQITLPAEGSVVHLRLHFPPGGAGLRDLEITDASGKSVYRLATAP